MPYIRTLRSVAKNLNNQLADPLTYTDEKLNQFIAIVEILQGIENTKSLSDDGVQEV